MYDYEKRFELTKTTVEKFVDEISDKEHLKKELILFLNKNLQNIEKLALDTVKSIKNIADK